MNKYSIIHEDKKQAVIYSNTAIGLGEHVCMLNNIYLVEKVYHKVDDNIATICECRLHVRRI